MATISITSLGLGNADLTAIGKLSETGLSQVEVADAVVEGDKLKKGNKIVNYDGHLTNTSNPHNTTASQVGAYSKIEVDNLLANIDIGGASLTNYYDKTETETLLSNKVDKEVGKGLSTNDFTDTFKQALESNKVQNITTNSVTKKLVVTYTDGTFVDLNLDDVITDVKVEGAILDATTNVLTILSSEGGADVVIDLSLFVTNQTLSNALVGKADEVHTHSTSDIDGLDTALSNKVTKNETIIGGTKTKITYDSKGLVLNGADLLASDIPNLPQNKIINLVSDLSDKQSKLISGTNIKTINGQSVLGSGDIVITGGGSGGDVDLTNYYTKEDTDGLLDTKQDTLVSGTSIKTINGQSVLGNGNIFVTAEADLSNYYTKPQVNEFINEIYAELDSPANLGAYGLKWNQETDVYEVLGATNRTLIQRNMKRCVLNDDGTVNYYLDPTNSNLKEDGTPSVLTGADGNVMVQVPKFWYNHTLVGDTHEWWVSNTPIEGYSVHPWFLEGGVERPFRYYRAYTCTNVSGKLRSISSSTPTRSQARDTFRTQARANGTGWELCSWNAVNAIQLLFLTEYCTFNTQAVLGRGNDTGNDYGITTGQSNGIGNASSGIANNDTWMSYRGIENWYADCWEFVDGINVQNHKVFLNQNPATFADDVFTGDYVDSGVTVPPASNNFIKKISGNFIPTADGGSSSTYVTDACWTALGNRVMIFGGHAYYGLSGGGFAFSSEYLAEILGVGISAGLSR